MSTLANTALGLTMIAAFLLLGGGIYQLRTPANRQRGWLMIACAVVFVGNVLIWTV